MAIYLTIDKSPAQLVTAIFDADGFERAQRYKQGLVLNGFYREDQIRITGTDFTGGPVAG